MKQNICVIGLNNPYVATIGKCIADAFDMFFADVTEFIKFELMDVEYARVLVGDEYVHKVEKSKVRAVNSFENTLFTMDYSLLNDEENLKITKECSYIIYLKLNKRSLKKELKKENNKNTNANLIYDVYEFRDKLCEKYADFVVDCNTKESSDIIKDVENKFMGLK